MNPGFILINKPKVYTSFECVAIIRTIIGDKSLKVGHGGTLDPFATGLLIIAVGKEATKQLQRLLLMDKVYIACAKLGEKTDTLDHTGTIIETSDAQAVTATVLTATVAEFNRTYEQVPPIYSARRVEGKRLYELVHKGTKTIDELHDLALGKAKTVQLHDLLVTAFEFPFFTIKAHVSHGTYIRSLMNDIAKQAGSYATTYTLQRTHIGPFKLENAIDIRDIKSINEIQTAMIDIETFLTKINQSKEINHE